MRWRMSPLVKNRVWYESFLRGSSVHAHGDAADEKFQLPVEETSRSIVFSDGFNAETLVAKSIKK